MVLCSLPTVLQLNKDYAPALNMLADHAFWQKDYDKVRASWDGTQHALVQ